VQVCPVSCIPVDPAHIESRDSLWAKYQGLQQAALPVVPIAVAKTSA
jgi:hypothetical protein